MALEVAIGSLAISLIVCLALSIGMFKDKKYIVWGIFTMFVFSPLLTWIVSTLYGISVGDGFAAVALMMVMFPSLFLVGIVILLVGIYRFKTKC